MTGLPISKEVMDGVNYMKKSSTADSPLYNKISDLIEKTLSTRPKDAINFFQHGSMESFIETEDAINQKNQYAELQVKLFEKGDEIVDGGSIEREEEFEIPLNDCCKMGNYFEMAGIGLGNEETFRILLALKQLALECTFISVRLWGKMFGIEACYFIAEAEYREGDGDEIVDEESENEIVVDEDQDEGNPMEESNLPKSTWKPPPILKPESHHNGTNKYVYFVCNYLGQPWIRLPHVTPSEIVACRKIKKFLTGKLDAPISSYPVFPGNEAQYLRALIARISACTQISPAGYYMFDEEDDVDEEEETRDSFFVNVEFEGLPKQQLADDMCNWVHSLQYILPQGRCTWLNPFKVVVENDFDDDDDDDDGESEILPETGPSLLSSIANDSDVDGLPAWSSFLSSKMMVKYSVVFVRSNRWPGAYTFSNGKAFENIYIGWGQKYSTSNINPEFPPSCFEEYLNDEEITEMDDPTLEQENAFKQLVDSANKSADEIDHLDDEEDE